LIPVPGLPRVNVELHKPVGGGRGVANAEVRSSAVGLRIEAPKGVGCGEGVSPSPLGERSGGSRKGGIPLPRKSLDFGSQYGEFWCILGVILFPVQLPVLHAKQYNLEES